MQPKLLSQFEVLVFDVYGTLVDWETGMYEALQPLLASSSTSSSWNRKEVLTAFESVEKDLQVQHPEMPYNELLAEAHKELAKRLEVPSDPAADKAFGLSIALWRPFPDTVAGLASLKKHYKLIVLSNVDTYSFNSFTRKALEPEVDAPIFDAVVTAQDVKSYKPNLANLKYVLDLAKTRFRIESDKVLVTAQSLFHDHKPANILGLHSSFIDREGACLGVATDATYDFRFSTLGEMAEAREKETI